MATLTTARAPSARLVLLIPQLEGRRSWGKDGRLTLEDTPHNRRLLKEAGAAISAPQAAPSGSGVPSAVADAYLASGSSSGALQAYQPKEDPFPHQALGHAKLLPIRHGGNFSEQGTGKTKMVLDIAGERFLAGQIGRLLVVSKKGPHRQWIEAEAPRHLGVPFHGSAWPDQPIAEGEGLGIYATYYEAIKTPRGEAALRAFLALPGAKMGVLDESHRIKNPRSATHKAAIAFRDELEYRALATGTPIAKDLTDEWAQLIWLDPTIIGIKYITTFRREFCVMGGWQGKQVIGTRNMERFRALTDPYIYRATKEEIGFLPKLRSEWVVNMLPAQRQMIAELRQTLELEYEGQQLISQTTSAVVANKSQQIASGFVIDDDRSVRMLVPPEKNPKLNGLMEYIENLEGEQSLIWARFHPEFEMIRQRLTEAGISFGLYYGPIGDKERAEAVRAFNAGELQLLVLSEAAGGTGLNLQLSGCKRALYYSHTDNSVDRWQSEDRIDRIGGASLGGSLYTDLIARGSFDRTILRRNGAKKELERQAVGPARHWLLDQFKEDD